MSLLRSTCDRCYAAKTRCTKEQSSRKCRRCIRADVDCNYSPRGQAGRPLGSISSNQALRQKNNSNESNNVTQTMTSYEVEEVHAEHIDIMAISDDDIAAVPLLDRFSANSVPNNLVAPSTTNSAIDSSVIQLDDFVRFSHNHDSLSSDGLGQPFFFDSSEPRLNGSTRTLSAELELAAASASSTTSSAQLRQSVNSSISSASTSSPHRMRPPERPSSSDTRDASRYPRENGTIYNSCETLHRRLVAVHYQLAMLAESLNASFNMAEDVEGIYRASIDFKSVLDSYQPNSTNQYSSMPIGKCHGVTTLLILGCYSYQMEAFELLVEKLQEQMMHHDSNVNMAGISTTSGSATAATPPWAQPHSPQLAPSAASMIPNISIGSVRVHVSNELTAEIHKRLIHQTAQNLKASLRQCVRRMAAARFVPLDVEEGDDSWSPISKLIELGQRELQRREEGILMYLGQSL